MYKTYIRKWRLDKKNKESDMKAIVRKRAERLKGGKTSAFLVRGRAIEFEEVARYWGRKGVSIEDIEPRRDGSATPMDVKCLTPAASRTATPVPAPMTTPDALAIPEQILISVQHYVKSSFESGKWRRTHPGTYCYRIVNQRDSLPNVNTLQESYALGANASADMDIFTSSCGLACNLFSRQRFQEAGATLIRATAAIKQIVLAEDPHTLIRLLRIFQYTLSQGRHEINLAILRQFSSMGELLLGERHPLPQICRWLASHDQGAFQHVLETCSLTIADVFAYILGGLHSSALMVSTINAYITGFNNHAQVCSRQRMRLMECESQLDCHDYRIVEARGRLMQYSFIGGDTVEAERHAWIILACSDRIEDARVSAWYRAWSLRVIAHCHFRAGQVESAIVKMNEALAFDGSDYGLARICLLDLEEWHSQQGNHDAATQARNKRLAILETRWPLD